MDLVYIDNQASSASYTARIYHHMESPLLDDEHIFTSPAIIGSEIPFLELPNPSPSFQPILIRVYAQHYQLESLPSLQFP